MSRNGDDAPDPGARPNGERALLPAAPPSEGPLARIRLLTRLSGHYRTLRTRAAIADRECLHDGSEPQCMECIRNEVGW